MRRSTRKASLLFWTDAGTHKEATVVRTFAYRAIDLSDRFPQPLESFREALECLQSDCAYLPELSGEIIAYLRGGYALTLPDHFFLRRLSGIDATLVPPEENDAVCAEVETSLSPLTRKICPRQSRWQTALIRLINSWSSAIPRLRNPKTCKPGRTWRTSVEK